MPLKNRARALRIAFQVKGEAGFLIGESVKFSLCNDLPALIFAAVPREYDDGNAIVFFAFR